MHSDILKKKHQKVLADRAYLVLAATKTIMDESNNNKDVNDKTTSVANIVVWINTSYNTDLNVTTVRRPIQKGLENVPP